MPNSAQPPQVVIIGGGFGGLRVTRELKGFPVDVTVIDKCNHHLFQPLLYQVATAGMTAEEIAVPIRSVLRSQRNARVLLGEVVGVDLARRFVSLADGAQLPYDFLVVAAGAVTSYFGHDTWREHTLGLKNIDDALAIRNRLLLAFEAAEREADAQRRRDLLTFAVIGGGPTGVEMAGAIAELSRVVLARDFRRVTADDIHVVLVEMAPRLLTPFHTTLSEYARTTLKKLGVQVRTGVKVVDINEAGIQLEDGLLKASMVCWAAGVAPARLGLPSNERGQVEVNEFCALPSHPEVFAIGDIAVFVPKGEKKPLPGLAPVAMQMGHCVARSIKHHVNGKPAVPFHYLDKGNMATLGASRAVLEFGKLRMAGVLAWFAWIAVHVYYLIGFRSRTLVLFEWFWAYTSNRRGARLIAHGRSAAVTQHAASQVPIEETSKKGLRAAASR